MYRITIKPHLIKVEFTRLTEITTILAILHFYFSDPDCVIHKILLITDKGGIDWYNDITSYKSKPLIYFFMRLRGEDQDFTKPSSQITEGDLNNKTSVEIHTLNEMNKKPTLLPKKKLLKLMVKHWINHI